ncbi:zinc ribbon domain-containing protein [Paenibacillus endoradicis]|uniref:zinc ribbon domain-containing protein n=1 Tax=Paenibacillus endoradicis TaxID=2972487 RepID=UPI0021594082|nr:hypothetical protein [Paenibacillus endoradicis]MCR8658841.1 hypothetical protein [Paenibacillus endoradicis]
MNCVSCGTTNLEGAVHCHNCGTKLALEQPANHVQEVAASTQQQPAYQQDPQVFTQVPLQGYQQVPQQQGFQQVSPQQGYQQVPPQGYAQSPQGNNYQQQPQGNYPPQQGYQPPYAVAPAPAKDQLKPVKDYFKYVLAILKRPHVEAFSKDKNQILFGAINIIAFAVLFGLTTWFYMNSILDNIFGQSVSFVSSFLVPVIVSAICLAIGGCVAFGLNKLNKLTTNFVDVMSQWFAYMALPAAIMPLIFLITLVGLAKLAMLLLAVVVISVFASGASIVKNYKIGKKHVIDPMYSTGIMFAVQGLFLYFLINELVSSFVNNIGNSLTNIFGG